MKQATVRDDFYGFTLTVNGTAVADLASATNILHYGSGNHWNVVETFIPVSAFETGATFNNVADASWVTLNTNRFWTAQHSVEVGP